MILNSICEAVGNTPLLSLKDCCRKEGLRVEIYAKLEYFNPTGSVKDRIALAMIEQAEKSGKLKKGGVIIEPTSGNTGIAIAAIAAARGYRAVIVMPKTMSEERRKFLKAYGAELVLTDGASGMAGAVKKAEFLKEELGGVILNQFSNPANPAAHEATGAEIWADTRGKVDILVAGVGTGGTLTGAGKYLKSKNPIVKAVAVEPYSSPYLSEGRTGAHKIQGIGAGFLPRTFDAAVCDEIITVEDEEAISAAKSLAAAQGIFVGISSGAAMCAAKKLARREENYGKTIVAIFPDSGDRYLSVFTS